MTLVFATNNINKIREIKQLVGHKFNLLGLSDIDCLEELPETQSTIEGNASQKSNYVYSNYKVNCFSDDTGLEIEALEMRPGVLSARYAGEAKDAEDNMNKVLLEMRGVENRRASFKTVISLIINGKETRFEGVIKGYILENRQGKKGFGYDPIFAPDLSLHPDHLELQGKSFAEMDSVLKNKISHRALAVGKLILYLKSL